MQDYHEFMSEAREAFSHIGQRITRQEAARRLSTEQGKRLMAPNFMTREMIECRTLAGKTGAGPCIVEISHGVGLGGDRCIGITVFHVLPESRARDHAESNLAHSISEAADMLRALDGGGE